MLKERAYPIAALQAAWEAASAIYFLDRTPAKLIDTWKAAGLSGLREWEQYFAGLNFDVKAADFRSAIAYAMKCLDTAPVRLPNPECDRQSLFVPERS